MHFFKAIILFTFTMGACFMAHAQSGVMENNQTDSLSTVAKTTNEIRAERGLVDTKNVFIPKGQWIFGGTASYSTHVNNNYTFLIIENIKSDGYSVKVSPFIGYAFKENMALGVRFTYGRTLLKVEGGELNMGDEESGTHIATNYNYRLKHSYTGSIIYRPYIPLGQNKRFALFTEVALSIGGHQTKEAADSPIRGMYETGYSAELGVSPGIIAFATNSMAIELSVGMMGIGYTHSNQIKNQVEHAEVSSSNMSFRINLLAIGLGVSFYL